MIRTPDQRLRVFISSTLEELKNERLAAKKAVSSLRMTPVMFELGARPYAPRDLYSAYLEQSHVFIGIYGERYGWVAPDMEISGLEDEFQLSANHPRLIYIKKPAPAREPRLETLIRSIMNSGVSCKFFADTDELAEMIENDLALLLTERFESDRSSAQIKKENAPIPSNTPHLIGRDTELAAVKELLRQQDVPVLTLTGTGGIGKTSMAQVVAREMQQEFRDGVFFVPLASVNDASLVPATIVQHVFPGELGGLPPLELLKKLFQDRRSLLVLDNFEQVIGAAPAVGELSRACPGLTILITSREALRLSIEHEYRVPMLALPDLDSIQRLSNELISQVTKSSAVQLFVHRAQAIDRSFTLTAENAAAVAEICSRLDGLPLAIELAAARIRVLTPQAMLQHLGRSLSLLSNGSRDLPDRHRTLMATIDWSYSLLLPEEQKLLTALSIFSGGCTLNAATAVAGGEEFTRGEWPRIAMYLNDPDVAPQTLPDLSFDLLEKIESLAAKNLIHCVERAGEKRFIMFATIKEFAQQHLQKNGDEAAIGKNHFNYFLTLAENLWSTLRGRDARESYAQLDAELDNMREALNWALVNEPVTGLRLALALGEYWDTRGMPDEQIHWTGTFLEALSACDKEVTPTMAVIARVELARAAFRMNDLAKCEAYVKELREIMSRLDNDLLYVDSLMPGTMLAAYNGQFEHLAPILQEGLAVSKRSNYDMATIEFLQNSSTAANFAGRFADAVSFSNEALKLATGLGATRWETISYSIRGFAQMSLGQLDAAAESFLLALQCSRRFMDMVLVVYPLIGMAQIALAQGDNDRAAKLLGAVERFCDRKCTAIVPVVRHMISLTQQGANTRMGDDEYLRSHALGREMELEDAMTLAEGKTKADPEFPVHAPLIPVHVIAA